MLALSVVLCKGKKKSAAPSGAAPVSGSTLAKTNESMIIKSGIKPPTDTASAGAKTDNKDGKEGEAKTDEKEEKKEKSEDNSKDKDEKKNAVNQSMKPFPKFVMPTESARKRKEKENEEDKNKKIKEGFYQAKSDEDDTLEKIESLKVEKSDKTKRSQRNKK